MEAIIGFFKNLIESIVVSSYELTNALIYCYLVGIIGIILFFSIKFITRKKKKDCV